MSLEMCILLSTAFNLVIYYHGHNSVKSARKTAMDEKLQTLLNLVVLNED